MREIVSGTSLIYLSKFFSYADRIFQIGDRGKQCDVNLPGYGKRHFSTIWNHKQELLS